MASYTVEQCDAKLTELQAALDELALLPTRGSTGKTSLDLSGASERVKDQIETWQLRRDALLNGGIALRTRREC